MTWYVAVALAGAIGTRLGPSSPAPKIAGTVCSPSARGSSTVPAATATRALRACSTSIVRPSQKWPHTVVAVGTTTQSVPAVGQRTNWHGRGRCGSIDANCCAK